MGILVLIIIVVIIALCVRNMNKAATPTDSKLITKSDINHDAGRGAEKGIYGGHINSVGKGKMVTRCVLQTSLDSEYAQKNRKRVCPACETFAEEWMAVCPACGHRPEEF